MGNARKLLLLAASYLFYGAWDWRFLGLIVLSSAVDFLAGARLARAETVAARRGWLGLSLVANLSLLGYFKYLGFFVDSALELGRAFGLDLGPARLDVVLPVGISFYTFQTLSYTIDIARDELRPARSALDFFLFVAFFPQLVAGPIVRAADFLPQLDDAPPRRPADLVEGFERFLVGLFKKLMIADVAAGLVDVYFDLPELHGRAQALAAISAFSLQIYFDFSGYSDMAIGLARMLGYRLPENFRLPFLAGSITDFWRRWHISLSSWFRDYLYIPLGGNRRGPARTYLNLALVFLATGLWHGAAWTFVAFGVWHGLLLVAERILLPRLGLAARVEGFLPGLLRSLWVLPLVIAGFLLFRAPSLGDLGRILRALGHGGQEAESLFEGSRAAYVFGVAFLYHLGAATGLRRLLGERLDPWFWRPFFWASILLTLVLYSPLDERPFVYFAF
ncbi:MAG: MBOAT family protein [Planctomycetes bacterium]|nr:MBOAT family protein [Planctomycetota bacterium]